VALRGAVAVRWRCGSAPTSPRRHPDVAPTSPRRRPDVAAPPPLPPLPPPACASRSARLVSCLAGSINPLEAGNPLRIESNTGAATPKHYSARTQICHTNITVSSCTKCIFDILRSRNFMDESIQFNVSTIFVNSRCK